MKNRILEFKDSGIAWIGQIQNLEKEARELESGLFDE